MGWTRYLAMWWPSSQSVLRNVSSAWLLLVGSRSRSRPSKTSQPKGQRQILSLYKQIKEGNKWGKPMSSQQGRKYVKKKENHLGFSFWRENKSKLNITPWGTVWLEESRNPPGLGYLCLCHSGNICKSKWNVNHLQPHPRRQAAQSGPKQRHREEANRLCPREGPWRGFWVSFHVPSGKETLL